MYSWFTKGIIRHYILIYLLMLLFKSRKQLLIYIFLVFFAIRFIATLFGIDISYLFDGMSSPGAMFAYKEDAVVSFISKRKNIIIILFSVFVNLLRIGPFFSSRFSSIKKIFFVLLVLSVFSEKKIENRFLKVAGKLSLKLYMSHSLAKKIIRRFYGGPLFIQDFLIYVLAFAISYGVNLMFSSLDKKIRKLYSNRI